MQTLSTSMHFTYPTLRSPAPAEQKIAGKQAVKRKVFITLHGLGRQNEKDGIIHNNGNHGISPPRYSGTGPAEGRLYAIHNRRQGHHIYIGTAGIQGIFQSPKAKRERMEKILQARAQFQQDLPIRPRGTQDGGRSRHKTYGAGTLIVAAPYASDFISLQILPANPSPLHFPPF